MLETFFGYFCRLRHLGLPRFKTVVCNSTRLSWCNSRNANVSYLDSILCRQMQNIGGLLFRVYLPITVSSSCLKNVKSHSGVIAQLQLIQDEFQQAIYICFYFQCMCMCLRFLCVLVCFLRVFLLPVFLWTLPDTNKWMDGLFTTALYYTTVVFSNSGWKCCYNTSNQSQRIRILRFFSKFKKRVFTFS